MAWITFVKDVKPEGDESAAPIYKKGDSHDVSEGEAKRCVSRGLAEYGRANIDTKATKISEEQPSFRPRPSKPFAKKQSDKKTVD